MERNAEIQHCRQQIMLWTMDLQRLEAAAPETTDATTAVARQNMARNAKIQVNRGLDQVNPVLEAERRSIYYPACVKDQDRTGLLRIWRGLSEDERYRKDIVLLFLSKDAQFFGFCPWDRHADPMEADHATFPENLLGDRDLFLEYARGDREGYLSEQAFELYDSSFTDDKEIMTLLSRKNYQFLEQASTRLKDDYDVVLAASVDHPLALQYASDRLKGNKAMLIEMVEKGSDWLWDDDEYFSWLTCALPRFSAPEQKEIIIAVVAKLQGFRKNCTRQYDGLFSMFPETLFDDRDLMMNFVSSYGYSLKYCSERLRADKELVKAAVKKFPSALEFNLGESRNELTSNHDFMTSLIQTPGGGSMLVHAPIEMQHDKNTVLEAVANGLEYSNVPSCFQSDTDVALKALQTQSAYALKISEIDVSLQNSKTFAIRAIQETCHRFIQLPEHLQQDEDVALQALKSGVEESYVDNKVICRALKKVPSLLDSGEGLIALGTAFNKNLDARQELFSTEVSECHCSSF